MEIEKFNNNIIREFKIVIEKLMVENSLQSEHIKKLESKAIPNSGNNMNEYLITENKYLKNKIEDLQDKLDKTQNKFIHYFMNNDSLKTHEPTTKIPQPPTNLSFLKSPKPLKKMDVNNSKATGFDAVLEEMKKKFIK